MSDQNVTPDIYARMAAVMAEISHVGKDQENRAQGFKFRGIDQVYNELHRVMAKHQVFTTSEILAKTREERPTKNGGIMAFTCLRIRYTFHTVDGSSVSTEVEGEGMDSGDKSSNKAMAVGHKYALLQAFLIPTEEQKDPDAESPQIVAISGELKTKFVQAVNKALASEDGPGLLEVWDEQSPAFIEAVWSEWTNHAKGQIRKLLHEARSNLGEGDSEGETNG